MIRAYLPPPLTNGFRAPWFTPVPENMTYKDALPPNFFDTDVVRTNTPEEAQVIVLQSNFRSALSLEERDYVTKYADLGERLHKPVVAFSLGDFTDGALFDSRVTVLRFSLYKHTASPRDVAMPNQIGDIGVGGVILREKTVKPRVSFCGFASPPLLERARHVLKDAVRSGAKKSGIYWRRSALDSCTSPLLETNFILRSTFSGNIKTIELDPQKARKEFIETIRDSDFVLAPKGDGNFSNRFLEAIAMGRIPVLIDTDVVLPLENLIEYSKIIVRVPMSEVQKTPEYVRAFYDPLSNDEWQRRQQLARETFEKYLRQDAFLRHFFAHLIR